MGRVMRWLLLGGLAAAGCAGSENRPADSPGSKSEPRTIIADSPPPVPTALASATNQPDPSRPSPQVTEAAASSRSAAIGKPAPAFELPDQDERLVSLASLRGKWVVLYFYPADDTPGCTCQATEFTSLISSFTSSNACVYGVSSDVPTVHQMFIAKYGLRIPLLSDPPRDVMRKYGAWVDIEEGLLAPGVVIRSTYLINPQGIIMWHWPEVIPQGHADRVMQKLKELSGRPPGTS